MLTADRPEMTRRAIESFRAQTYENKRLLIFDTSTERVDFGAFTIWDPGERGRSIGHLRNAANANAVGWGVWHLDQPEKFVPPDILMHFDSDDVSHPLRMAEQVEFLLDMQSAGDHSAQVVGYSDLVFWNSTKCMIEVDPSIRVGNGVQGTVKSVGEAWLYSSDPRFASMPGSSFCYWRSTWENKPFPDQPRPGCVTGEDVAWLDGLWRSARSSVALPGYLGQQAIDPRLIASIHDGNTSGQYRDIETSPSWRRAPEWDEYCRKAMLPVYRLDYVKSPIIRHPERELE